MKQTTRDLFYWTPRVICIISAMFIFLLSFEAFNKNYEFGTAVVSFLGKLLPTLIILLLLFLSHRWAFIGAITFNLVGLIYISYNWGKYPFISFIGVTGPMFIVGFFFLVNWIYRDEFNNENSI